MRRSAIEQARAFAASVPGGTSLKSFQDIQHLWTKGGSLEIEVKEQTDTSFTFNVTRCRYAETYKAMGLDWRYLTVEVHPDHLAEAVRGARAMGFKGFNCTIPHKVEVMRYLDELTPAAAKIGAVNCVAIQNGKLLGENTDGKGFLQSVRELRDVKGAKVVLLGAGGAARAIAVELALAGASHMTGGWTCSSTAPPSAFFPMSMPECRLRLMNSRPTPSFATSSPTRPKPTWCAMPRPGACVCWTGWACS